jgi:hypothetical protein
VTLDAIGRTAKWGGAGRRPATCHPERRSHSRGLCNTCCASERRKTQCSECGAPKLEGRSLCRDHLNSTRAKARLKRYGISDEEYRQRWKEQGGKCAICGAASSVMGELAVDHDHTTGDVRGLLCSNCNLAIGNLRDSPALCRRAAEYLAE